MPLPGSLVGDTVSAWSARVGNDSATNRRSRNSSFIAAACKEESEVVGHEPVLAQPLHGQPASMP
jgi:hypothetical protein